MSRSCSCSRSARVKRLVETLPVTSSIVTGYVPGETTATPSPPPRSWSSDGLHVTLDYLGEDTLDVEQAEATVAAYVDAAARAVGAGAWRATPRCR